MKKPIQFWHHGHPWISQWIGFHGKILTGKPHDLHRKIYGFRFQFSLNPWNSLPPPWQARSAPPVPGNWSWCIAHTTSSRRHFDCSAGRRPVFFGLPPVQMRLTGRGFMARPPGQLIWKSYRIPMESWPLRIGPLHLGSWTWNVASNLNLVGKSPVKVDHWLIKIWVFRSNV